MAVEEDPPAGVPEWVVTFGDMMSLLLTFFIMLVSMSEIKQDDAKFRALVESLRERFGDDLTRLQLGMGTGMPAATKSTRKTVKKFTKWDNSKDLGSKIKASPGNQNRVRGLRPGSQILVGDAILFDDNSVELTEGAQKALKVVAENLQGKPQRVEVRGHTSKQPLPLDVVYRDHWDLAYARCRQVMQFLVASGIDARRIRIGVAATNEPSHMGADPLLLKENSRVEVFMLGEVPNVVQAEEAKTPVVTPAPEKPEAAP
jgi:chemotaxis protein MotB